MIDLGGYYELDDEFVTECPLCARPLREDEVCRCDPEDEQP